MTNTMRWRAVLWGLVLTGLTLALAPLSAQTVVRVSADVDLTGQGARCDLQYVLKNGKDELKEIPLSAILYHGTGITNLSGRDAGGPLAVSGAAAGDKFAGKIALATPLAAGAEYSFSLGYGVTGAVQDRGRIKVSSAPMLHMPWRPVLSKQAAMSIRGALPQGTNLVWASPRYLTQRSEGGRVVVTTSSPVLASYFRVEYTAGKVGFFTPRTTAIVAFFGGALVLIAIWLLYAFGRGKRAKA